RVEHRQRNRAEPLGICLRHAVEDDGTAADLPILRVSEGFYPTVPEGAGGGDARGHIAGGEAVCEAGRGGYGGGGQSGDVRAAAGSTGRTGQQDRPHNSGGQSGRAGNLRGEPGDGQAASVAGPAGGGRRGEAGGGDGLCG